MPVWDTPSARLGLLDRQSLEQTGFLASANVLQETPYSLAR
jgi:hypothetical protein